MASCTLRWLLVLLWLTEHAHANLGPQSLRGVASSAPTHGEAVVVNTPWCAQPGNASDEIKVSLTNLPQINMSLDMEANMDMEEEEDADDALQEAGNHAVHDEPESASSENTSSEEEWNLPSPDEESDLPSINDEANDEAEEKEDYPTTMNDEFVPSPEENAGDDEDADFGSDDLLMDGWWSSWHGAPKQNNSKYAVKVCPQGTFIKAMQMVMSSTHNHSLQRIEDTRCSRSALRHHHRRRPGHFHRRRPGHFHRRRPGHFHRRRPGHFHRRRFHHNPGHFHRRRFHHNPGHFHRRRFHHNPGHFHRRRFHHKPGFHHRTVQSEHFREAIIFSNSSVDGLCFGGKCAGHVGAGSGVMCGNESRLAGYAIQYDCKIRSIRFFCRHMTD